MKDLQKPYQKTPPLISLRYPVIATPKIDGIRCAIENGVPRTFNKKPIPNNWVRELLTLCAADFNGFDGELIVQKSDFNGTQSGIMTIEGKPSFKFLIFDIHDSKAQYKHRIEEVHKRVADIQRLGDADAVIVEAVEAKLCRNAAELQEYWNECIAAGYEGVIANAPEGLYKNGRSGLKEQLSVKLKVWHDDEATVIGFEEEIAQDGTPKGRVGRITLQHSSGVVFGVGGLTDEAKAHMWSKPEWYLGRLATFKYQDWPTGGAPRFPGWKGLRHD